MRALGRPGIRGCVVVVVAALALCSVYFSYTGPVERNPDALAHLEYVRFVLRHGTWPGAGQCTACHHPPLYYLGAAAAFRFGELVGLPNPARAAQALPILLTAVFLGFAVGTFRALLARPWQQILATALVALWPYTIIQSTRINPDVAVNAVSAVALYLLARWWRARRTAWLLAAIGFALVALSIKASAMALVAAILCVVGATCLERGLPRAQRRTTALLGGMKRRALRCCWC